MAAGKWLIRFMTLSTIGLCSDCQILDTPLTSSVPFINLECTYYGGWESRISFSIKIDQEGNAFITRDRWQLNSCFKGKLNNIDLVNLGSLVVSCKMDSLQDAYHDLSVDGDYYAIWITKPDSSIKKIHVTSWLRPSCLDTLQKTLYMIQDTVHLQPVARPDQIRFVTRNKIYPTFQPPIVQ